MWLAFKAQDKMSSLRSGHIGKKKGAKDWTWGCSCTFEGGEEITKGTEKRGRGKQVGGVPWRRKHFKDM